MAESADSKIEKIEWVVGATQHRVIAEDGDCSITARTVCSDLDTKTMKGLSDCVFKVKKQALKDYCGYFSAKFKTHFEEWKETDEPIFKGYSFDSIQVLLELCHDIESSKGLDLRPETIWNMISLCDRFLIQLSLLEPWFDKWWEANEQQMFQGRHEECSNSCVVYRLLYPSFALKNARAFMKVSNHMVYTSKGHIEEGNPFNNKRLHTPIRVVRT